MAFSVRSAIAIASVGAVGFVSSCAYAKSSMTEQVRLFRRAITESGPERGGRPPTEQEAIDRVSALAQQHRVIVQDIAVSTEDYSGLGGMLGSQSVAAGLTNMVNIRSRRYTVTGSVRASKWLWSTTQALEAEFNVRLEVTMSPSIDQDSSTGRQMREVQQQIGAQRGM
jgi:hypothetical protein